MPSKAVLEQKQALVADLSDRLKSSVAGVIVNYEKISYPNCQGQPVAFGSEDGAFRAPEYIIDSAPDIGEAPYEISYVDELPTLVDRA